MASPASILKHPIHPMFVVFPLGLLIYSLILDLIAAIGRLPHLYVVSYYLIRGGFIGGLVATRSFRKRQNGIFTFHRSRIIDGQTLRLSVSD